MADKTITKEGIKVEVGQVWRDLDKRMHGRQVTITHVDAEKGFAHYKRYTRNKINTRRMYKHSTGWELVTRAGRGEH